MKLSKFKTLPFSRFKVRGLVRCGDEYLFLKRSYVTSSKYFLVCPGGRVENSDRVVLNGRKDLEGSLRKALEREIFEDLGAQGIEIGEILSVSRPHNHFREVLFAVTIDSYNWDERTGPEFSNLNRGSFELVRLSYISKYSLGRAGYRFLPKEWRKVIREYAYDHR